ncbi:MAG: DUF4179 domain-containing protein [Lachnospiraceae bacterium]|nr:DUF4179 domain-containing protein [Lachnospiraceae bacterium]
MNKELYQLANNLTSDYEDSNHQPEPLTSLEIKKYSQNILNHIHSKEKQRSPHRHIADRHKTRTSHRFARYVVAAACTALLLSVTVFSSDVHAAIEHIRWSLSSALGLSGNLADYRDIINTSVTDNGYIITLQEAVATEEKLVINYTIQREDGQSMGEIPMLPSFDSLYINGKHIIGGVSGGGGFIDDEHTVIGISRSFDIFGIDTAVENTYQLKLDSLDDMNTNSTIKGNWDFSFTADGSDLIADTKTVSINKSFTVADGVTVTLEELSLNELEQRIVYHMEGSDDYLFQLTAVDNTGRQVEFDTKIFQSTNGTGYMQNQEYLYDGRINNDSESIMLTLFAVEMPKESGQMSDDYYQIGEPFELKLQ